MFLSLGLKSPGEKLNPSGPGDARSSPGKPLGRWPRRSLAAAAAPVLPVHLCRQAALHARAPPTPLIEQPGTFTCLAVIFLFGRPKALFISCDSLTRLTHAQLVIGSNPQLFSSPSSRQPLVPSCARPAEQLGLGTGACACSSCGAACFFTATSPNLQECCERQPCPPACWWDCFGATWKMNIFLHTDPVVINRSAERHI